MVILNWNGSAMLRSFLPSVVGGSKGEGIQVYVADNGSTDNSLSVLREQFPSVRVLELHRNYGFAEGYNMALRQVEARYAVLLNSDVEVVPGWLTPLYTYMESHPDVAACQPKIKDWKRKDRFEYAGAGGGFIDRYGYPFCRGRIFGEVETDTGQYDRETEVFWVSGAAMFIRLADYREVGGLDGRFFAHMEEIDLCWRLKARGRRLVYVPSSVVWHVGGATLKKENPHKTYLNFRNNLLMLYKNLPTGELRKVMAARLLFDYVAIANFLFHAQFADAHAVLRARRDYNRLRKTYRADRTDNLKKATCPIPTGRMPICLLWQYYIKKAKHFPQLMTSQ